MKRLSLHNDLKGPRYVVELGEKVLDYNEKFRLFLATRSPESQLPPNVASILAIINFTTTRAGLTGQVCSGSSPSNICLTDEKKG